jgi:hypothetical protein
MRIYYITIATLPHPVLEKLKERVRKNGETIEVLGQEENRQIGWENQQRFGIKLREVACYLKRPHLNDCDIILFTDAYDVAYFGTQKEVLERYIAFNCPIVFGCEKECHPDPARHHEYKNKKPEFPFLNSGLFIGTVKALRQCIGTYEYDDKHDDQRYWTTQFLEYPELITLDYGNKLFLNTSGFNESLFIFDIDTNMALYKSANPLFVHVNGPEKSFINQLCGIKGSLDNKKIRVLENQIDIIINVGPNDISILKDQIKYTKKNVKNYRNIYLISYDPNLYIDGCITVSETQFPFTMSQVEQTLGKNHRNGWYFQQLLKMYAGKVIDGLLERFVCIDADTFFVKPIEFINPKTNKPFYCYSKENHQPYFDHMKRLHPTFSRMDPDKSGICHHMVFEKRYLQAIIETVETYHGKPFHSVFLESVDKTQVTMSGASEFEIYFNFMLRYHPAEIELRLLIWEDIINWVSIIDWDNLVKIQPDLNYDFIGYHHHLRKGNQWIGYEPPTNK